MRKWLIAALLLASLPAWADVKLGERKAVEGIAGAVDVAVTPDGRRFFVLTDQGEIRVIGANGKLEGTVRVEAGATRIESIGRGERLAVVTKDDKVELLRLDFQVQIDIGASPVRGDPKAPVAVVVFTDFQCPYCSKLTPSLERVLEKFPKDVKIVLKNFPLPMHKQAMPAALASLAAHRQGKFWPYHDKLFENSAKLTDDYYLALAKELKLDLEKFKTDLKDPSLQALVAKDMADGQAAGVGGTPTVFVNGVRLENRSDEGFDAAVEEAIKAVKK